MSQLSNLEDLKDLSGYKKDLKKSLDKVQASPAKMFYAPVFEFKGRKGPMVLVGEVPSGLSKGLKEAKVTLKAGRCRRNERGDLEVFKGLDPGKIGLALKSAGIAEQIADKEIEDESPEDQSTTEASEEKSPVDSRMERKLEFETAEFEKRAAAAFKTKEKDVLVEVQKFAADHKDDPGALQGIKDVKSEILAARELAAKSQFDEANGVLDRISKVVRFTGAPTSKETGPEGGEPTVLGYSDLSPSTQPTGASSVYGQPIPVKGESHPDVPGSTLYSTPEIPVSGVQSGAYGRQTPVQSESHPDVPGSTLYSTPEIPGSGVQSGAYGRRVPVQPGSEPVVPDNVGQPEQQLRPNPINKEFIGEMKGINLEKGKFGDAAQTDPNEFGFKTKPVGEEYIGEHEKVAWRSKVTPDDPNWTTRKYSDEERKEKSLDVDDEGRVRNADGTIANENTEYVLDPKTGKMIKLQMRVEEVSKDPRTGETVRTPLSNQDIRQARQDGKKIESTHHSSPLGGYEPGQDGQPVRKGVASAGSVEIKDGKVKKISNASGHYKPKLVQLLQTLEHLAKQGAILDKTVVDAEGRNLKDTNPKAFAVYGAVKKANEKAKQLAADAKKIMTAMDTAESEEEVLALASELDSINKTLLEIKAKTDPAAALLRGIGAGPANKIDPGAKVEFVEGTDKMTGLQFHTDTKKTTTSASEFMETGGGNREQAQKKTTMLDDLKKNTADERKQLDEDGQRRADAMNTGPGVSPTESDFEKALKDLDFKPDPAEEFETLGGIPELERKFARVYPDADNPYAWSNWDIEKKIEFLKK